MRPHADIQKHYDEDGTYIGLTYRSMGEPNYWAGEVWYAEDRTGENIRRESETQCIAWLKYRYKRALAA